MENASKALIIAGEVLIGLIILGFLVFSISKLGSSRKEQLTATQIQQIVEFNKSFESYNRNNLYGNDIISIINKIEDYNKLEAQYKGYLEIKLKIIIKNSIVGTTHFQNKTYSYTQIRTNYNNLKNEIDMLLQEKYNGKDLSYYSGLTSAQLNVEIAEIKSLGVVLKESTFRNNIYQYNLLSTVLKEFKKKRFACQKIDYDVSTNRIINLEFSEI